MAVVYARAEGLSNFQFYYYQPSMAAAAIFTVLFSLATVLHGYQMIRTRTWFMIPFVIGGIFEMVGYVGRVLSAAQNPGPYTLGPYIIQSILLLIAPALFAASIYMELGRIVLLIGGEKQLIIRRTYLTKLFVLGDVLAFQLQAAGGGLLAGNSSSMITIGKAVIIAGLFLQVVFFGLFVVAALLFNVRMRRAVSEKSQAVPWEKHMASLYAVSLLILVRSIVRVVEYLQGYDGYIIKHEVFLYVFDAALMWLAMLVTILIHPSEVARLLRDANGSTL